MADDGKEGDAASSRGAEWEVVSLTASTYAAAPGPKGTDSAGEDEEKESSRKEQESSGAMFMSEHFIFPPSQHENLPIEPEHSEIQNESGGEDVNPVEEDVEVFRTQEDDSRVKSDHGIHGIEFIDNESSLSLHSVDLEEGKEMQRLSLVGKEQDTPFDAASTDMTELHYLSQQNLDSATKSAKPDEEDEDDGSGLPCEAWWKRHAACLYHHAKEANTFWSVFVAAALMGIVVLGRRWQREKLQFQQLKWHFNDERLNKIFGPIGRFKDVLVRGHRNPLIRGGGGGGASANC